MFVRNLKTQLELLRDDIFAFEFEKITTSPGR